jgi:hypothetical protein
MVEEGDSSEDDMTTVNCDNATDFKVNHVEAFLVNLSWNAPGPGSIGYEVEYGLRGFSLGNGITVATTNSSIRIEGLVPFTNYDAYLIRTCLDGGISSELGPVTFKTELSCFTPAGIDIDEESATHVEISWTSVNAIEHTIEYGETGFTLGTGQTVTSSNEFVTLEGLNPSTTYQVYIQANCDTDELSAFSEPFEFTTLDFDDFVGGYRIRQVSGQSIGGIETFTPDGSDNGVIVTLHAPNTALTDTEENVVINQNERAFDAEFAASLGLDNTRTYVLDFSRAEVLFEGDQDTGFICSEGEIILINPADGGEFYDSQDDVAFNLSFVEDPDNICGSGPINITLIFSKQ